MLPLAFCVVLGQIPGRPGPQLLLVTNDGSRRLWKGMGLPWDPRSAPGTPMSLAGREAPGGGGEEPPVPPRPSAGSRCCRGSRRYSPRRHEGPPATPPSPARVHGVSDGLEGDGLREQRPQVQGGNRDAAGGARGTEGRLPAADGRDSCAGTAGDAVRGLPGAG